MDRKHRIVDFRWCKRCKYWETPEEDEPCRECLNKPTNEYTERPINYKEEV